MALDDAWSLAAALSTALSGAKCGAAPAAAVRRGLAAYEAQRLAKTSRIVKLSRTLSDVNHSRSAALCWLRDRLTGLLVSSGQLQKQMAAEISAQPVLPLGPRP
jgi:2-polyprenyl-6-methoxyphenol hydroxylase-like FAD-dependent oxidoreductase